ncbi:MAG: FAD-dependent oxidoreductase [Candidatus Sulfotelmatobacter sp.]
MSPFQTFSARMVCSSPLSEFTKHLEFEIVGRNRFGFVAGQWLSFRHRNPDGEEITRAYSICTPPADNNRFALCLNRVQDGFMSNFLCDMKAGEEISLQGPFGDFVLHPPMRDTIFIATGTGIAPFRSMLQWLFAEEKRHEEKQIWLLFGNRYEGDIYYNAEFLRLADQHPNFHYLPALSRPEGSWQCLRGYVQQHVPEIVEGRSDMHAYICGLDKMVKANRELLKSLGWDRKAIRYEKYD